MLAYRAIAEALEARDNATRDYDARYRIAKATIAKVFSVADGYTVTAHLRHCRGQLSMAVLLYPHGSDIGFVIQVKPHLLDGIALRCIGRPKGQDAKPVLTYLKDRLMQEVR